MLRLAVLVLALAVLAPATADAAAPAAPCPRARATPRTFADVGPGGLFWLENLGFDRRGGMWVSELQRDRLVRYRASGRAGAALAVEAPGASLLGPDGRMYVLYGDGLSGRAGVLRFAPGAAHPVLETYADGLAMANGAAFDAAGDLYVSDSIRGRVARVRPDGTVERAWVAGVPGADGVAVLGKSLYVTEVTDPHSTIVRVPLARPAAAAPLTTLSPSGDNEVIDDLAVGPDGRLYVASNRGRLIRLDPDGTGACVAVDGLSTLTSVRFAAGFPPYGRYDAFLTSIGGTVTHVRLPAPPRIRLRVRPRRVPAGRPVRLRVRVTSAAPCRGGVRVRGTRTGRLGRARVTVAFAHRGRHVLVARKPGCRPGRTLVRAGGP